MRTEHNRNNFKMLWSLEDDQALWAQRSKKTSQLAAQFGKTAGAIRSRLKHLQDPTHKAYKRRISSACTSASGRSTSNVIDLTESSPVASAGFAKNTSIDLSSAISSYGSSNASTRSPAAASSSSVLKSTTEPSKPRIDPSTLNSDQTKAASHIFSGANAFLTGPAGVGKSYLLNYLIQGLKDKYSDDTVVVAAATGIAATHIGGVTIHSWAGVRLGVGGAKVLVPRVMDNKAACARWKKAKVLILDEVSVHLTSMIYQLPHSFKTFHLLDIGNILGQYD